MSGKKTSVKHWGDADPTAKSWHFVELTKVINLSIAT